MFIVIASLTSDIKGPQDSVVLRFSEFTEQILAGNKRCNALSTLVTTVRLSKCNQDILTILRFLQQISICSLMEFLSVFDTLKKQFSYFYDKHIVSCSEKSFYKVDGNKKCFIHAMMHF